MTSADWGTLLLSLKLAVITSIFLTFICVFLGWWLSQLKSKSKVFLNSFFSLPIVLPPTVIGFYLLLLMGPEGAFGITTDLLGLPRLAFSFPGLVVGSIVYSFPFVLGPIQSGFESISSGYLRSGKMLGGGGWAIFKNIGLPLAWPHIVSGAALGFAHTLGEFGIILMIGGNIPGETRVASLAIYDYVENLEYDSAHRLSIILVIISVTILLGTNFQREKSLKRSRV